MKILIVDDHPLFSDGLARLVTQLSDDTDVTTVHAVAEAIAQLAIDSDIDLVLLDLNMPEMDGISLLQRFKADDLYVPVIVISSESKLGIIRQALELGAMGFIPKSLNSAEMLDAMHEVLQGAIYVPKDIQKQLSQLPASNHQLNMDDRKQQIGISKKQYETLELLAKGLSNQQIATTLNRSEHTIKSHLRALFQILGASNRTECVNLARQQLGLEVAELVD